MVKEDKDLNCNSTTFWEDLFTGFGAFVIFGIIMVSILLPIQLLYNFLGIRV